MRRFLCLAGLALCLVLQAPAAGAAEADDGADLSLQDLQVRVDGNLARVSFHLEGSFTPRLRERLESGLPTSFVYHLELLKDRKRWFDRGLDQNSLQVVAMYDAATRGYLINYKLDGKLVESRMVRDMPDLERAMTEVDDLPAFELGNLPRAWRLLVRARAEVGAKTVLFFIPAHLTTDWQESNKFRTLNELPDSS